MVDESLVDVERAGPVARIFLNRPEKANALSSAILQELARSEKIHAACQAIRGLPVPVVARLHGALIGAGLEIAASCDLRVASLATSVAASIERFAQIHAARRFAV